MSTPKEKTKDEAAPAAITPTPAAPITPPKPIPVTVGMVKGGLVPTNLDELYRFSTMILKSKLAPKGFDTVEQIMSAIQLGLELGLQPMAALTNTAVINGRPSVWGDAAIGLCYSSGMVEEITEVQLVTGEGAKLRTHQECFRVIEGWKGSALSDGTIGYSCYAKRKGATTGTEQVFTVDDAKTADLLGKDIWKKYGRRMIQMRARGFALRDQFPDALKGLLLTEELLGALQEDAGGITQDQSAGALRARLQTYNTPYVVETVEEPQLPATPETPPQTKEPEPPPPPPPPAKPKARTQSGKPPEDAPPPPPQEAPHSSLALPDDEACAKSNWARIVRRSFEALEKAYAAKKAEHPEAQARQTLMRLFGGAGGETWDAVPVPARQGVKAEIDAVLAGMEDGDA